MPRRLPSLNHLILGLHEQAAMLAPAQFGQAVLRQCQPLLGFDSAMFGSGTIQLAAPGVPGRQSIHAFELYEQPVEKVAARQDLTGPDPILDRAARSPGQLVTMDVAQLVQGGRDDVRRYCQRFGVAHSTVVISGEPARGVEALAVWHGSRRGPGVRQLALAAQLMPHLLLARRNNARFHALTAVVADGAPLTALASQAGHLHHAPPAVLALLQREWPQFQPPWLPQALVLALASGGYAGRQLVVQARPLAGGLMQVALRPARATAAPASAQALTPAEARVAELVAAGLSYKQVAQQLQRAPATVRNQLQRVYDKLGLRGKTALALAWRQRDAGL